MTERRFPDTYRETISGAVHCEAGTGPDFTLCGYSLDGDQGEILKLAGRQKISCRDCLAIINFCRGLPAWSINQ